jgi:hypothetical protein
MGSQHFAQTDLEPGSQVAGITAKYHCTQPQENIFICHPYRSFRLKMNLSKNLGVLLDERAEFKRLLFFPGPILASEGHIAPSGKAVVTFQGL